VPPWLAFSIVASVALTLVLNVALRVFPGARLRLQEALRRAVERVDRPTDEPDGRGVHVVFPWKVMLVGSLVLTLLLNLIFRLL
jgi:hypothetical protein